jgi:hypothetical protein
MTRRLDFSNFQPSAALAEEAAKTVEAVIPTVGSGLWGGSLGSEFTGDELAGLPDYRRYLENRLDLKDGVTSAALVDWSALRDTCDLLEGSRALDPFVGLANLAAVVGAVIFHDRVVVIDADDMVNRANRVLGLDGVIRGIELADQGPGHRLRLILDRHYSWAWHELGRASKDKVPWIQWLQESWQQLLPGATFPDHASREIERVLGYNTSPMRASYMEILFGIKEGLWVQSNETNELILDNDVRALVYERFAQSLDTALSDAPGRPSIVYVGGCLRSPMLLTRARWADECLKETTQPEAFLQRVWAERWASDRRDVQLPFWMTAVIASARSVDEVADRVRTLRRSTKRTRQRRGELCESLRRGEPAANRELFQALAADLEGLTADWEQAAEVALEVGTATLQVAAPGTPAEIVKPALKGATIMGDDWLRSVALRLFRPRVYAVYQMAASARELTDVLGASSRLFNFEQAYAAQPIDFMHRLGKIAWMA